MPQDKDPLADWIKTTLYLRVIDGPLVEFDVWHPPGIPDKERVALLAKYASGQVKVIWKLRDKTPNEAIVQGQYKHESTGPKKDESDSTPTGEGT